MKISINKISILGNVSNLTLGSNGTYVEGYTSGKSYHN